MTTELIWEEFTAIFPEPKVKRLTGDKWHLKVNDRKLFTLVGSTPYMNVIYIYVRFKSTKHLQFSIA